MQKHLFTLLLCGMLSISAIAQHTISGTVTNEQGDVLIGVTLLEETTSNGTATDLDGRFELNLRKANATLLFSYTGYNSKRVKVKGKKTLDVVLDVGAVDLEEVVVVGYGTQKKSSITGSVTSVEGEELEQAPVTNLTSALQGRVPGLIIAQNNGKTGSGINVNIRGASSINASNSPLFVVDGVPGGSLINFNDVESVEVLKDAAATAIYGSRASNGVILITTKKGSSGKPQFTLDVNTGFSQPTRTREWLDAEQYMNLWEEAYDNVADGDGSLFGLSKDDWRNFYIPGWDEGHDTDWQDAAFNDDAGLTDINLSVSGGSGKTKYYISGGILNQTGILIDDEYERISGRMNLTHEASDQLELGLNTAFQQVTNDRVATDNEFVTPIQMIAIPPVQPLRNPDQPDEFFENTLYPNGAFFAEHSSSRRQFYNLFGSTYLNWTPIRDLTFHTDFGLNFGTNNNDLFNGSRVGNLTAEPGGYAESGFSHNLNVNTNNYVNYKPTFGVHALDITAGMNFQEFTSRSNFVSGRNFPNDNFQNVASAADIAGGSESETANSILSYFLRTNYQFDKKYLISLSGRIDGSSRFGTDNRYGFFPAASVGWIASEEPFIRDVDFLSYLKVRTSLGQTGNQPNGNFSSLGLFGGTRFAGIPGINQTQLANPDLGWEKTTQANFGIDIGVLEDRIFLQADYYIQNTSDLLLNVQVPASSGFFSQLQNIGSLENKGFELLLTTNNLTGPLSWTTTVNFSQNRNKVTDINEQVINGAFTNRIEEGQPIGVFFTREYAGVDPDNGDALYYVNSSPDDRSTTNDFNEAERVIVGDPNPDFIYGITNNFSYKGIELSIFFQGVQGNDIFNAGGIYQLDGFGWFDNQDARILDRWQQPGDVTDIPQVRFLGGTVESSRFIEDGSYLRLRTLTLAYNLPESIMERLPLRSLRIYGSGQNLWTWTNYQGWDPEVNADTWASTINRGLDFYSAPQATTVVFGAVIGF